MCTDLFNARLSPMTATHAAELCEIFPREESFISDLFRVMTEHFCPQVNLLVMFSALKHLVRERRDGALGERGLGYVPLSVVTRSGEHEYTRYRPRAVRELHTSFLPFMMAKRNVESVESVCDLYGTKLSRNHCCGVIFGPRAAVEAYEGSEDYRARCTLRSYAESMGMPIVEVEDTSEVPGANIDLRAAELRFFELYESCMHRLTLPRSRREVDLDPAAISEAWRNIVASEEPPSKELRNSVQVDAPRGKESDSRLVRA